MVSFNQGHINPTHPLTAILASAVLIEVQVSNLLSKMMINFTPGCRALQTREMHYIYSNCLATISSVFILWT